MKKDRFMVKYMLMLIAFFSINLTMFNNVLGQGVVVTTPPINGTTTWGGITYNLQTTQAIIVDTIYVNTSGTVGSTVNLEVWYNPTAINGQPATFTGAPWVNIISSQAVDAGVDLAAITIPGGLSIPAASNWGFYIGDPNFTNTGVRYGSSGSVSTVTDGIVTIEIGNNVGYGWVRNSATTNHPRYFAGGVNYNFAAACTGAPTAGNAVASTSVCANENFSLSLAGNTSATDLTYQWMSSSSA
ncbi:hypothetical protein, partial [Brumimicrobium mesophilum]|uniref:hypothetical protein n=1 Tax=Brumimicrobium mesophilum TaxID=392717 RepID=UPI00131A6E0A